MRRSFRGETGDAHRALVIVVHTTRVTVHLNSARRGEMRSANVVASAEEYRTSNALYARSVRDGLESHRRPGESDDDHGRDRATGGDRRDRDRRPSIDGQRRSDHAVAMRLEKKSPAWRKKFRGGDLSLSMGSSGSRGSQSMVDIHRVRSGQEARSRGATTQPRRIERRPKDCPRRSSEPLRHQDPTKDRQRSGSRVVLLDEQSVTPVW